MPSTKSRATPEWREYNRQWRKNQLEKDPQKVRAKEKNWNLNRYGISLEEFDSLREKQNYCCAICGQHEDTQKKNLFVDHCHETGRVRGLLCNCCNFALGHFKDSQLLLQKAINYLGDYENERYQGKHV